MFIEIRGSKIVELANSLMKIFRIVYKRFQHSDCVFSREFQTLYLQHHLKRAVNNNMMLLTLKPYS